MMRNINELKGTVRTAIVLAAVTMSGLVSPMMVYANEDEIAIVTECNEEMENVSSEEEVSQEEQESNPVVEEGFRHEYDQGTEDAVTTILTMNNVGGQESAQNAADQIVEQYGNDTVNGMISYLDDCKRDIICGNYVSSENTYEDIEYAERLLMQSQAGNIYNVAPVVPEVSEIPETTVVPETTEVQETSEVPETPEVQEAPVVPETPEVQEAPVVPETPEVPETTVETGTPEVPETTVETGIPEVPETTVETETPVVQETTEVPEAPVVPEASENDTKPEETQAPENNTKPEDTQESENDTKPEETQAPEKDTKPEDEKKQNIDDSKKPDDQKDQNKDDDKKSDDQKDQNKVDDQKEDDKEDQGLTFDGIINSIDKICNTTNKVTDTVNKVKDTFFKSGTDTLKDTVKDALSIASPKDLTDLANTISGIENQFSGKSDSASKDIMDMVSKIKDAVKEAQNKQSNNDQGNNDTTGKYDKSPAGQRDEDKKGVKEEEKKYNTTVDSEQRMNVNEADMLRNTLNEDGWNKSGENTYTRENDDGSISKISFKRTYSIIKEQTSSHCMETRGEAEQWIKDNNIKNAQIVTSRGPEVTTKVYSSLDFLKLFPQTKVISPSRIMYTVIGDRAKTETTVVMTESTLTPVA